MSGEAPTVRDIYMSSEMGAAIEMDDAEALAHEIQRQKTQLSPTSEWLEIVSVQLHARDEYVRHKNLLIRFGLLDDEDPNKDIIIARRAAILAQEFEETKQRLGPLTTEVTDPETAAQVRAQRIHRLCRYGGKALLSDFRLRSPRPASSVPRLDAVIRDSRSLGTKQVAGLGYGLI